MDHNIIFISGISKTGQPSINWLMLCKCSSTTSKTPWVLQLVAPEIIEKSVWRDLAVICYYRVFLFRKLYGPMHLNNIIYAENTNKNIKNNHTKYFANWECDLKFIEKDDP